MKRTPRSTRRQNEMNVGTLREAFSSEEHQPAFVLFLNDMRHAKIEH